MSSHCHNTSHCSNSSTGSISGSSSTTTGSIVQRLCHSHNQQKRQQQQQLLLLQSPPITLPVTRGVSHSSSRSSSISSNSSNGCSESSQLNHTFQQYSHQQQQQLHVSMTTNTNTDILTKHYNNNSNTNGHTSSSNSSSSGSSSKVAGRKRCCFHSNSSRCWCCRSYRLTTRTVIYFSPFLLLTTMIGVYIGQRALSLYLKNISWEYAPYHFYERTCTQPNYYTYTNYYNTMNMMQPEESQHSSTNNVMMTTTTTTTRNANVIIKPKICITTLTDEKKKSFINKVLGWRNFDGIMALTWENKYKYAQKHNYYVYDESHVVNHTRGPAWFKIIAALRLLQEEQCDWVFWMDADIVIMNSTIAIEDFLPYYQDDMLYHMDTTSSSNATTGSTTLDDTSFPSRQQPNYDLLLSIDLRGSSTLRSTDEVTKLINGSQYYTTNTGIYNSGAWIIRNSEWSINFLTTWWNMKSYVQPIGHSFSGDNDAMKALLRYDDASEFNDHCLVPPRCTFNSFAKFVRSGTGNTEQNQQLVLERTYHEAFYHKTDFVAHVAGVDNKRDTIKMLLEMAE